MAVTLLMMRLRKRGQLGPAPRSHRREVAAKGYESDEILASIFELQLAVAAIVLLSLMRRVSLMMWVWAATHVLLFHR